MWIQQFFLIIDKKWFQLLFSDEFNISGKPNHSDWLYRINKKMAFISQTLALILFLFLILYYEYKHFKGSFPFNHPIHPKDKNYCTSQYFAVQ
jgi:hypothetical protein